MHTLILSVYTYSSSTRRFPSTKILFGYSFKVNLLLNTLFKYCIEIDIKVRYQAPAFYLGHPDRANRFSSLFLLSPNSPVIWCERKEFTWKVLRGSF